MYSGDVQNIPEKSTYRNTTVTSSHAFEQLRGARPGDDPNGHGNSRNEYRKPNGILPLPALQPRSGTVDRVIKTLSVVESITQLRECSIQFYSSDLRVFE